MAIIEGEHSFQWFGSARVLEDDRELAWAEPYVRRSEDVRWILGNYIQTSSSDVVNHNSNGHAFPLEDVTEAIKDLPHRPLNYLHIPNRRVGAFAAAELVYPESKLEDAELAQVKGAPPIVEALACYWLYYDSEGLWPSIEKAYKDGELAFSMEAVPEQITCGQCSKLYDYDGPSSQIYCDHLQQRRSRKILHRPHFLAGALIAPPVKPGWRGAHVKEISQLLEADTDRADAIYREIAGEMPAASELTKEQILYWLLTA